MLEREMDADGKASEVERELLAKHSTGYRTNQVQSILSDWFPNLWEQAKAKPYQSACYRELVNDAEEILNKIKAALSCYELQTSGAEGRFPLASDPKESAGYLWRSPGNFWVSHQPSNWSDVSPVNGVSLDVAIAAYLKRPWLQHNLIDWAAIDALVFDETARMRMGVLSGLAFQEMNWAWMIAGNNQEKLVIWQGALVLFAFAIRWLIPPLVVGSMIYAQYPLAAKLAVGVWALYIIYRVASWPSRRRHLREKQEKLQKYATGLEALGRISVHLDCEVINPTRLKQLIVEGEEKGVVLRPFVHSLLDRAIQRDPVVFIRGVSSV